MDVGAGLRIAYSNQKIVKFCLFQKVEKSHNKIVKFPVKNYEHLPCKV